MIDKEKYEQIQADVIQCQALNNPCVLIFLDDEKLMWQSAANSEYETLGIIKRVLDFKNETFKKMVEDGN